MWLCMLLALAHPATLAWCACKGGAHSRCSASMSVAVSVMLAGAAACVLSGDA